MLTFDLQGKKAIVTGASSGLGVQFALELAEQGVDVAILARRLERLTALAKEIESKGVRCLPIECDVANEHSVEKAVDKIASQWGRVDILVNNAGVVENSKGLIDHTTQQWDNVIDIDLKGVFLMTRAVTPLFEKQHYGKVINISSVGGIQAGPSQISYYAAKGGVVNLTCALAAELAPFNVTVNAIGPGVFDTEMTEESLKTDGPNVLKNRTCLKRFGREGELNGALLYFASDLSTYTTAQTLYIDGGLTAML